MELVKKGSVLVFCLLFVFILSACSQPGKIRISDAKIASGVDDKLLPIKVTNTFPKDTPRIFCWFQWKNATINSPIMASWHFVTDDIHVLDYTFNIPRKEGSGSVSLAMPEGKTLPSGSYKVDLKAGKNILKSLTFKVE